MQLANILLIDDDAGIRGTARAILEAAGHRVSEAADGEQGIELFRGSDFDLVITDLYMPGKEGIETIQEILDQGPDTPILAMSGGGGGGGGALVDAEMLGATATLRKPFTAEQLRDAVSRLLGESGG